MDRGNSKHGAHLDEALKRETRGIVQAGRDVRGEEWHSPEPSGEDQPDVDLAPGSTLTGGVPEGLTPEDVAGRSELASLLGKEIWPADAARIKQRALEAEAPDRVIDLVESIPADMTYENVGELWRALTGGHERHRF